jgi:hypothetical protein
VALTAARHGGVPCGRAIEQQPCETLACPVDCIMDAWTDYSLCSASCGYGTQVKTRGIARQAQAGGVHCGARQATKKCHTSHCPVHCKYSDWTPFSACSITCGKDGTQTATRTIMQSAQNGGKACEGRLVDTQTCNKGACPVHCEVSEWGEWGACSKTCYNGLSNWKWAPTQYRTRTVTAKVANGGSVCPELRESRPCNHHVLCQVNCRLGTWGGWGQCTKACGGGSQRRTREIVMKQQNNGRGCAALWEQKSCNTKTCPTNCMYGDYTAWSACSKTCGDEGRRKRMLAVFANASRWTDTLPQAPQQVLRVRHQRQVLSFKVEGSTDMAQVLHAFTRQTGVPESAVSLLHKGDSVSTTKTLDELGIDDGDELVAVVL